MTKIERQPLMFVESLYLYQKLQSVISLLDKQNPQFAKEYDSLARFRKNYYFQYNLIGMEEVYTYLVKETLKQPDDWFPAYVRFRKVVDMIDLSIDEIPLISPDGRIFVNDAEFVCFAHLTRFLTLQEVFDMLGIDLKIVDP